MTLHVQYWVYLAAFVLAVVGTLGSRVRGLILAAPILLLSEFSRHAESGRARHSLVRGSSPRIPRGNRGAADFLRLHDHEPWQLTVATVLLAGAMLTSEGPLFAVCVVVAALAASCAQTRAVWARVLLASVAAVVMALPWTIWSLTNELPSIWTEAATPTSSHLIWIVLGPRSGSSSRQPSTLISGGLLRWWGSGYRARAPLAIVGSSDLCPGACGRDVCSDHVGDLVESEPSALTGGSRESCRQADGNVDSAPPRVHTRAAGRCVDARGAGARTRQAPAPPRKWFASRHAAWLICVAAFCYPAATPRQMMEERCRATSLALPAGFDPACPSVDGSC